jgi:hypothetical protein
VQPGGGLIASSEMVLPCRNDSDSNPESRVRGRGPLPAIRAGWRRPVHSLTAKMMHSAFLNAKHQCTA